MKTGPRLRSRFCLLELVHLGVGQSPARLWRRSDFVRRWRPPLCKGLRKQSCPITQLSS
ncbi:hypothetical protein [Lysobacter gummosus]|uniref:hypothetical protein n=1 Tax=Lysobacter gummosus TaxID=262324 RepID=UPI00364528A5